MDTAPLKRFAQQARRRLLEQVQARLDLVLLPEAAARRESPNAVKQLEEQIRATSKAQVVDQVAYTWFNRFCALRYMDVNRVNRIAVVSPAPEQTQPEILAEAKMGHIDDAVVPAAVQAKVRSLLAGTATSHDAQGEAYRLLVVAACNSWNAAMPFLFERIADYTELLMPEDLLSAHAVLTDAREAMTDANCADVEVIGWLYQFYISEKKDAVFDGMKQGKKITPDNIPAATQLFTPHWIVRYLVENSLGRLWMLNHPSSTLAARMDYYIAAQEQDTDFLRINRPEDIKVCDPACGSGHMLTYTFDLLYAIYEEVGTEASEIPGKILTHNLFGIEIDERAAELSAFALIMKAQQFDKRFFRRKNADGRAFEPNICRLQPIHFEPHELTVYMETVGRDLFTDNLRTLLTQFEEADNFGSLIQPQPMDYAELHRVLQQKGIGGQLLLENTHRKVLRVLVQAEYLSQRYQVVVANPPYMGEKGMTARTKEFAASEYKKAKTNLFSMFMVRIVEMVSQHGEVGLMTPISWMSLSSFESLRQFLFERASITSFVQPEYNAFWDSAHVAICAFTFTSSRDDERSGVYINLAGFFGSDLQPIKALEAVRNQSCRYRHLARTENFKSIPGSPIAYWLKDTSIFRGLKIGDLMISGGRNKTHDNEKYLRYVWEIGEGSLDWVPYANGGDFRKYAGNELELINWSDSAKRFYALHGGLVNEKFWGEEGITWSLITSAITGFRVKRAIQQYSSGSPTMFGRGPESQLLLLGFLTSPISNYYLKAISPTVNTTVNDVFSLPFPKVDFPKALDERIQRCVELAQHDWDDYETSQGFGCLPLLRPTHFRSILKNAYSLLRRGSNEIAAEAQRLEQENNRLFINAYGLQDELTSDVPLKEITLTCNPHFRYGGDKTEEELEALLLADTMREFLSYAVGCMFGRYSLDKPGLVLANQGDTLEEYLSQIPKPRFTPDEDNVIPLLDGEWFADDVTERFRSFLRVTFGDAHYAENLAFIEDALGKDVRKYFLRDFYTDHVKRYKKRPIYWLFTSPKGSFNALIYLHRYRPDTVSVVLQYLRDFHEKLSGERNRQEQISINPSASAGEKTRALKALEGLKKTLIELDDYERDTLYPLATQQIPLDLDDGVKVNYLKFGDALKKIPGLAAKDKE